MELNEEKPPQCRHVASTHSAPPALFQAFSASAVHWANPAT